MTQSNYDEALSRLLAHEGGYGNDPSDPGGPTNFGITIADYRRYVKADATAADVRAMKVDEAKAIYRAHYWNAMRCDDLPAGLDYAVFDYGVNSGTARAVKVLQQLLGLTGDGRISDAVIAAAKKSDTRNLVARLCDERLVFLKDLKTWPTFGKGWSRRVADVRAVALAMVAQASTAPKTVPATGKGVPPAHPLRRRIATAITSIGATLAGVGGAASSFNKETIMTPLILISAAAFAGYLASIFTWPRLRQGLVGIENEIDDLRARAASLEARLRG